MDLAVYITLLSLVTAGQSDISFLVGNDIGLRQYNMSSMRESENLMTSMGVETVDYHYQKNLLFVTTKEGLYKTTLALNNTTSAVVGKKLRAASSKCNEALAVDWVHNRILWVECDFINTIKTMDLEGENQSVILRRPVRKAVIRVMVVDPFAEMVFWIADRVIESCKLSRGYFRAHLSTRGVKDRSIALDLYERRVYYVFVVDEGGSLFSMDYNGGSLREHFSSEHLDYLFGFGVHKGFAYWADITHDYVLLNATLEFGPTDVVHELGVLERSVWCMKLMHQDLQPTQDPYMPKARETTSPTLLQCPNGYQLEIDEEKSTSQSDIEFLLSIDGDILSYNMYNEYAAMIRTAGWLTSFDYHLASKDLSISFRSHNALTTLTQKILTSNLAPMNQMKTSCNHALTIDWVHDLLFYVECNLNNIFIVINLHTFTSSILLTRPGRTAYIRTMVVDPIAEMIFWTADGVIESCELGGGNFQTNLTREGISVRSIALNLYERRIYYVGRFNKISSLFSMKYDGGSHREHFSSGHLGRVYGLGVFKGFAYWVNFAKGQHALYQAPLYFGQADTVRQLEVFDKFVVSMKLMHNDLQPSRESFLAKMCKKTSPTVDNQTETLS